MLGVQILSCNKISFSFEGLGGPSELKSSYMVRSIIESALDFHKFIIRLLPVNIPSARQCFCLGHLWQLDTLLKYSSKNVSSSEAAVMLRSPLLLQLGLIV